MAWTEKEVNLFESNCINIGYNMCKSEVFTILCEAIKNCTDKTQLEILKKLHKDINDLKCVWKRN